MTYDGSGINYEGMDPFKLKCQAAAQKTAVMLQDRGYSELEWTRGESVYLFETPEQQIMGMVEEGLGTKSLVADAMYALIGKSYYDHVGQDTVAMIVNDMITLGMRPLAVAMHLAVSDENWFDDEKRSGDLIRGWAAACVKARCTWSCGETPMLPDIIVPGAVLLSGSAIGQEHQDTDLFNPRLIEDGNEIVFVESSGIHANGLSLARKLAKKLPQGYLTRMSDGRYYGDALLDPTHLYVGLIDECIKQGVEINYAVNITGHGWRKLMRPTQTFEYVIETLPPALPIFDFIQAQGPVEEKAMYETFNMGAGFALYVEKRSADTIAAIAANLGLHAFRAGFIRRSAKRRVIIEPLGIPLEGETLAIR